MSEEESAMSRIRGKKRCGMAAVFASCVCAAMMSLAAFAADEFAPQISR